MSHRAVERIKGICAFDMWSTGLAWLGYTLLKHKTPSPSGDTGNVPHVSGDRMEAEVVWVFSKSLGLLLIKQGWHWGLQFCSRPDV